MAYTDTAKYYLYYRNLLIGAVTAIHHGMGWLTGRFQLADSGQELLPFIKQYLALEDMWGEDQAIYDQAVQAISAEHGADMVDVQYWRLCLDSGEKERQLAEVPFIDLELNSMSWRELS